MELKITILALLLMGAVSVASAQSERPSRFEFEIAGGAVFPIAADGMPGWVGTQLLGEMRYNFVPKFDVALQYSRNRFWRDYLLNNEHHEIIGNSINAFFDYN
jgi:hypothetical protein